MHYSLDLTLPNQWEQCAAIKGAQGAIWGYSVLLRDTSTQDMEQPALKQTILRYPTPCAMVAP